MMGTYGFDSPSFVSDLEPPDTYDLILQNIAHCSPRISRPLLTPWTRRALTYESNPLQMRTKYKTVDKKVRPVPSYMPDPAGQVFRPVSIPSLPSLPLDPPSLQDFIPSRRLSLDRLQKILTSVPKGFLKPREIDLLVFVLQTRQQALAFEDSERGTFSDKYFPDYEIPVIEHTPWVQAPIRIPKSIEDTVRQMLLEQKAAGKYEYSTASYRSRIFAVGKPKGGIRLVADVQELNRVTVRDAGLPPRTDDFAESFVGHVIYGLADLFSGYDGRKLAVTSRPLTTFSCLIGPLRSCVLPQGATNSLPEFQRCTTHALQEEIPKNGNVFVDDVGLKGPTSTYDNEEIAPGIRRYVYEYASTFDRFLMRFIESGITASGKKLVLATPRLHIVGTIVSKDGWHLEHGLVTKILNWGPLTSVTDVRSFLGTAGVGRKWIRGFSLIAKPLTLLTKTAVQRQFFFSEEAEAAQNELKRLISTAPVLVKLDYDAAKLLSHQDPLPRSSDHGLVIVAVDSCQNGTGWILFQNIEKEKHPVIFGSCTFNDAESRYSQAKLELYGIFRAVKDLRHRIWGIHIRIDVDAKFLIEMVKQPDLPNAPMTRWISYIALFDYVMNHVPAQSHAGVDGLSRRKRAPEDSEDEDAEEYLDKFMGSAFLNYSSLSSSSLSNFLSSESLHAFRPTRLDNKFFQDLLLTMRRTSRTPYASFHTTSIADDLSVLSVVDPPPSLAAELRKIRQAPFDPSLKDWSKGSLVKHSLLSITDDFSYTGREFEHRKVCTPILATCSLGEDTFTLEMNQYKRSYMSSLRPGAPRPTVTDESVLPGIPDPTLRTDNRINYEDVPPFTNVTCATHSYGVKDRDSPEMWTEIVNYLKTDVMPDRCENPDERKSFVRKTKSFFLHDGDRLWKIELKGRIPRLVVVDTDRRSELIAEAHNDVGHRGRDATYKTLAERFFWPNMFDQIAYFIRSCNICQLRSKTRPIVAFSPTWNSGILRRFDLDTIHMPDGFGGMKFLLQATDPSISWVEARAARRASSEAWAKFLYEEVYCRFGGVLLCLVDGGTEFKGAVEILFKQYGIIAIISSPYHPEGNGHSERSHQTLVNSILRACGKDASRWPLYLHAGLWAMRCSTSRVTGYPPYFLLYGRHPFFAFDFADKTWDTLDWHRVASTEDLLALRMQQILRRDKKLVLAMEQQKRVRQRAVDDFNRKHEHYLSSGSFILGTWVLLHETWLDSQMGHKGALRWTGPYIVHKQLRDTTYQLRELDGTVMRGSIAANRLKIFYYREEHQTIRTVQPAEYSLHVAASSSSSVHASTVLGTLNQDLLLTPPFPVSVKVGVALLPDNPSLTFIPTVKSLSLTSTTLHYRYLPAIAELNPTDYNTVQYVRYTSSSSMVNEGVREDFIETSTINVLESWALAALPLR
jgi:hypothetical protein